jgi:3-hydroxyacyl-CoA dehydrogenase
MAGRKAPEPAAGTVAMIGTGLIGRSWAIAFAAHGWRVALFDTATGAADAAVPAIRAGLDDLKAHGLLRAPARAAARVRVAASLADAVGTATFVQESTSEVLETKIAVADLIDTATPAGVPIASSTSAIVASRFTEGLAHRDRWLVGHPVNPPHLVPIVELCPASWTSPETVALARDVYAGIGQVPVMVNRETDGFVLNRLQAVLLREAFALVADGVCSPEDLDRTIRDGLGLRWSFMGPFETGELNAPAGLPDYGKRYGAMLATLSSRPLSNAAFGPEQIAAVLAQWPGAQTPQRVADRTRWRDRRLAALKAHKLKQSTAPE